MEEIITYWARHAFITTIMRKGASVEMVSGLLGYQRVATTKTYRAGVEDEAVKKVAGNLLDFDSVKVTINPARLSYYS